MIRTIKQLIPKSFNMNKLEKSEPIIVMPLVVKGSLSASFESDEDTIDSQHILVGVWLQTADITEEFMNNVSIEKIEQHFDINNFTKLTFNEDGTFTDFCSDTRMQNGSEIISTSIESGSYTIAGTALSVIYKGNLDAEQVDFILKDDQLAFTFIDETFEDGEAIKIVTTSIYNRQKS